MPAKPKAQSAQKNSLHIISTKDIRDIFFIERVLKALPVLRIALQRYSHRGTCGNSDASAKIVKILLTQKYFLILRIIQYVKDMSSRRVVELRDVSVYLGEGRRGEDGKNDLVLSSINLAVDEGELVYLIGRVGSGKSTLLKTLYAEVDIAGGEGEVVGFSLKNIKRRQIPYLRRSMGIVFQDFQLLTDRNVFYNLYDVMRATGWKDDDDIRQRIDEVLSLVDLANKSYKMPFELSGGEQQRLAIARALVNRPRLILADEPTGNLDPKTAEEIMLVFRRIVETGCAVIMSTHNISLIEQYPSRTLLFAQGRLTEVDLQSVMED